MDRRRSEAAGRRRAGVAVLGLAVVAGACSSPVEPVDEGGSEGAIAYDFTLPRADLTVYRWPSGSTVRLLVAGGGDAERARLLADALAGAIAEWESALGEGVVRFAVTDRVEAADVVVRWSDAPAPVDLRVCEPAVRGSAATTFCPAPDGRGLLRFPAVGGAGGESAVRMVVTVLASEARGERRVRQLIAHELGHVLGIGRHSPDPSDLMWEGALTRVGPSPADLATVQRLYETEPDLVP